MANEITIDLTVSLTANQITQSVVLEQVKQSISASNKKWVEFIQNIGTSEEAIKLGDIGTIGLIYARNVDQTNYVELRLGGTADDDVIKLPPDTNGDKTNMPCLLLAGSDVAAPFAVANSAACDVHFLIVEA